MKWSSRILEHQETWYLYYNLTLIKIRKRLFYVQFWLVWYHFSLLPPRYNLSLLCIPSTQKWWIRKNVLVHVGIQSSKEGMRWVWLDTRMCTSIVLTIHTWCGLWLWYSCSCCMNHWNTSLPVWWISVPERRLCWYFLPVFILTTMVGGCISIITMMNSMTSGGIKPFLQSLSWSLPLLFWC